MSAVWSSEQANISSQCSNRLLRLSGMSGDRIADDASVVRQWALEGRGIAYKSELDVAGDRATA